MGTSAAGDDRFSDGVLCGHEAGTPLLMRISPIIVRPLSQQRKNQMKTRSFLTVAGACLLQCLVAVRTHGAELEVLSAVGMRQVLLDLVPRFERASGHTIRVTYDASGAIVKRIDAGETADVVMITHTGVEQLTASGKILSSVVDAWTTQTGD
jgi:YD repeat-containing protein